MRTHIRKLEDAGHTRRAISLAAGLNEHTAAYIMRPETTCVSSYTANAILSVDPWATPVGFVPAIGTMRRLQALAALGWSARSVMERSGISEGSLHTIRRGERRYVEIATHRKVTAVYDALSMALPPETRASRATRAKAAKKEWPPPMAWDDLGIDDPAAEPDTGDRVPRRVAIAEDAAELLAEGYPIGVVADRLGVARSYVNQALREVSR